jgi:hypothetical protein
MVALHGGNLEGSRPTMNEFIDGVYVNAAGVRDYKLYVACVIPAPRGFRQTPTEWDRPAWSMIAQPRKCSGSLRFCNSR